MLVALFPLKEKSVRIKHKNFRNFCGKPLYKWMLDRLILNKNIKKIIINTDSNFIIKKNFKSKKIIIIEREKCLRGHDISMNKIIQSDINFLIKNYKKKFKKINILMTHATNPLITNRTINLSYKYYKRVIKKKYDSLFSVNCYQTRFYRDNMKAINHNPNKLIKTQDLSKIYEENSCLYYFSIRSFLKKKNRIGLRPYFYTTPFEESIDIDDQKSWNLAKKICS